MLEPPFISSPAHPSAAKPWLNAIDSCGFLNLQEQHCSLAFTTYQTGKLFLAGLKFASEEATPVSEADQTLSVFERTNNRCMGMCASPDVHDMVVDADSRVVFVKTMFGCLATFTERVNFKPLRRPPFVSALIPEDRCHLSGLAMRDGRAAIVTAVSLYLPHLSLLPP